MESKKPDSGRIPKSGRIKFYIFNCLLDRGHSSAQDTAQAFYKKLGYEVVGEGFLDAEMPHHRMDKKLV